MVLPRLQLLNCFWLLLPVFAWNAVFASRLPQAGFKSDAGVPRPILWAENVLSLLFVGVHVYHNILAQGLL
jgi:hypothetical protein